MCLVLAMPLLPGLVTLPWSLATSGKADGKLAPTAGQIGLSIAFLPHQAWIMLDAVVRTLWRMWVSRRQLLEWETAASAEATARK